MGGRQEEKEVFLTTKKNVVDDGSWRMEEWSYFEFFGSPTS